MFSEAKSHNQGKELLVIPKNEKQRSAKLQHITLVFSLIILFVIPTKEESHPTRLLYKDVRPRKRITATAKRKLLTAFKKLPTAITIIVTALMIRATAIMIIAPALMVRATAITIIVTAFMIKATAVRILVTAVSDLDPFVMARRNDAAIFGASQYQLQTKLWFSVQLDIPTSHSMVKSK